MFSKSTSSVQSRSLPKANREPFVRMLSFCLTLGVALSFAAFGEEREKGEDRKKREGREKREEHEEREGREERGGKKSARTRYSEIPPAVTQAVSFTRDVKPILMENCTRCHSAKKQKAELRLDTKEGILAGSEEGPVIKAGNGAGSMLVRSISGVGVESDEVMPPKDDMLNKTEIGIIRAWIDQGAKFDDK